MSSIGMVDWDDVLDHVESRAETSEIADLFMLIMERLGSGDDFHAILEDIGLRLNNLDTDTGLAVEIGISRLSIFSE